MLDQQTLNDYAAIQAHADQVAANLDRAIGCRDDPNGVPFATRFSDLFEKMMDSDDPTYAIIGHFAELGWCDYLRRQVEMVQAGVE